MWTWPSTCWPRRKDKAAPITTGKLAMKGCPFQTWQTWHSARALSELVELVVVVKSRNDCDHCCYSTHNHTLPRRVGSVRVIFLTRPSVAVAVEYLSSSGLRWPCEPSFTSPLLRFSASWLWLRVVEPPALLLLLLLPLAVFPYYSFAFHFVRG